MLYRGTLEAAAEYVGRYNRVAAVTWVISITTIILLIWDPTKDIFLGWIPDGVELPFYTEAMSTAIVLKLREFLEGWGKRLRDSLKNTGNAALAVAVAFVGLLPHLGKFYRGQQNQHALGRGEPPDPRLSAKGLHLFSIIVSLVLWAIPIGIALHTLVINVA